MDYQFKIMKTKYTKIAPGLMFRVTRNGNIVLTRKGDYSGKLTIKWEEMNSLIHSLQTEVSNRLENNLAKKFLKLTKKERKLCEL